MSDYIPPIGICVWYSYDFKRIKPTCDKGHRASARCHSGRKDCPDYYAAGYTVESNRHYKQE